MNNLKLTAEDLVRAIDDLPKDRRYHYVYSGNSGKILITRVEKPEGPIYIKRFNPSNGKTLDDAEEEPLSSEMIWRIANAFNPGRPINFDRVLGGSYNTRSVLEALLVHTPEFYHCKPGRIEETGGEPKIKKGHKHVVWMPNNPHEPGVMEKIEVDTTISEVPSNDAYYESLELPDEVSQDAEDIDIQRRHAQIQVALVRIGLCLNYRTWVAKNDMGIVYKGESIVEHEGVISSLDSVKVVNSYPEAINSALYIDCIWFRNSKFMPAVMEVEHSTGITSGLTRMKEFYNQAPPIEGARYVIVAPEEERKKAKKEANKEQFEEMNAKFFPYSAVEELYSLCDRRGLQGVSDPFLDSFMEPLVANEKSK